MDISITNILHQSIRVQFFTKVFKKSAIFLQKGEQDALFLFISIYATMSIQFFI